MAVSVPFSRGNGVSMRQRRAPIRVASQACADLGVRATAPLPAGARAGDLDPNFVTGRTVNVTAGTGVPDLLVQKSLESTWRPGQPQRCNAQHSRDPYRGIAACVDTTPVLRGWCAPELRHAFARRTLIEVRS
jgi:hypothetical protein